jgi:Protein of unknown function (DUF3572)
MPVERRPPASKPQERQAQDLAIAALAFLAVERERFARFLDLTGITVESVRAAAREPGFLAGVLDHLASEEPLLLTFAAENGIGPAEVVAARNLLAGTHRERDSK